jgi:hypothetical protein
LHHRQIERRVVGCATDVADCLWFAQHPCRTGKGVELLALRLRGQQQQKYQIDRLAIDGLEVNRLGEADQNAKRPRDAFETGVRDGDAGAGSGRARALRASTALKRPRLHSIQAQQPPGAQAHAEGVSYWSRAPRWRLAMA